MKSKGIHWVERIYQKFETVCEDVDSTMSQEPMKYVGNPVNTVGRGVKKFCSSVMQDFLPTQLNPGKVDIPNSSPEECEYIDGYIHSSNLKENGFYVNGEQLVEVQHTNDGLNQETTNSIKSLSSFKREELNADKKITFCNVSDVGVNAVSVSVSVTTPDVLSQMNVSSHSKVTDSAYSSRLEKPQAEGSVVHDHEFKVLYHEHDLIETPRDSLDSSSTLKSSKGDFISHINDLYDALPNTIIPPSVAVVDVPSNDFVSQPVDKLVLSEFSLRSNTSTISSESKDVNPFRVSVSETSSCSSRSVVEQGWESSTLDSSMTFSDICISDDMNTDSDPLGEAFTIDDIKLPHSDLLINRHSHFRSSQQGSLKSYKNLLQDTLNSKRRLVKEYKQLGIWHGDIHEELQYSVSMASTPISRQMASPSNSRDMTTVHKQGLSEWEVL